MDDEDYMYEAISEAKKAGSLDETPIGCVIVRNGEIIARGFNKRNMVGSVFGHAEIEAMKKACAVTGDWRLEDCTLYVTLEPCPMCAGAIVQARIPRVVIGAMNPKAGCAGSVLNLFEQEGLNHQVASTHGVLGDACGAQMSDFFRKLRRKQKKSLVPVQEEEATDD